MRIHFISTNEPGLRHVLLVVVAAFLLLVAGRPAVSQCFTNPTDETSIGLKNASSHFLIFYIDGINMGGVPPGDRSVDFIVSPGEHILRAETIIDGETVSATRSATIPAGYVCTWTVTDPPNVPPPQSRPFKDLLRREAHVPIVGLD